MSIRSSKKYYWLKILLQIALLLGLTLAVYQHRWFDAFLVFGCIILTLLPSLLSKEFSVYIPPEFELITIVFIISSVILGRVRGFYNDFWWWDKMLHARSGFLLGIFGFLLVYVLNQQVKIELHMKPGFVALFSFTFAVAVGALWEIYEFAMDELFALDMQYNVLYSRLEDTMWDLIVDTAGGFVISLLGYFYMKHGKESFINEWIYKFIEANPRMFKKKYRAT